MKKNGRTIKEDFLMIRRGIREFEQILPGQMKFLALKSVIEAFTPYIAIVMSALILNELVGNRDGGKLSAWVILSIGVTLLLSCVGYWLEEKIAVGYSRLFSTHEIVLTDKAYRLPYDLLEQESTRSLREQVSGSIGLTGGGMASLYWDMEVLVTNLCSGIAALALGIGFAGQVWDGVRRGRISGGSAAMILFLLIGLVGAASFVTCKIASRRFAVSFDVFEQGAKYNRYGEFYDLNYLPDEDMAMDIRFFRQEKLVLRESQLKCYQRFAEGKAREMRAVGKLDVTKVLCGGICGAVVYGMMGYLALLQVIGVGNVLMLSATVSMLITAFSELAQIFTDLRNNNAHLEKYFAYMDLEESRGQRGTEGARQDETRGEEDIRRKGTDGGQGKVERKQETEIYFERVSFRYPGSKEMVLKDISLRIGSGERLAIVGENGSGKTTLIKLLCRLYRPVKGRILLNGRDIWDYPYEEYIRKIATVFQDFALFAFPIAENVAASRDYDERRVYEALCRADLQKKVDSLGKGVGQAITHDYQEDGMELSGGEAQKVAIARAIYKEAPIVILDEPTAALDPYAEKEIYQQFFENLSGETMVSISHRLSSCRFCDEIAVLHRGRLVQLGSHEELLKQSGGRYARLWEAQARYYQICDSAH